MLYHQSKTYQFSIIVGKLAISVRVLDKNVIAVPPSITWLSVKLQLNDIKCNT